MPLPWFSPPPTPPLPLDKEAARPSEIEEPLKKDLEFLHHRGTERHLLTRNSVVDRHVSKKLTSTALSR